MKHQVTLSADGVPIWSGEATIDVACGSRDNMAPGFAALPHSVSFTMSMRIPLRRVLVTGGRDYSDERVVARCLELLAPSHIIEGGASGADTCARRIAKRLGIGLETYPADWARLGRRAGHERNARMLRDGKPDVVLALPGGRGTADMVARARRARFSGRNRKTTRRDEYSLTWR